MERLCQHHKMLGRQLIFVSPFSLGPARTASPGPKAIVGRKGQESRVVDGLFTIPALYDHFHVVVEANRSRAPEILEGPNMLAHGTVKFSTAWRSPRINETR